MKTINGKAIYSPGNRAAEYGRYACNFYVGCSNSCTYCYLKQDRFKAILGGDKPTLKKSFKNEGHALEVFEKELIANYRELQKCGLFLSFTTDPFLPECIDLTCKAIIICIDREIPVRVLTKMANFMPELTTYFREYGASVGMIKSGLAFGFTLTGHDELEPGASTNAERIEAMQKLYYTGFKTFASIEPIIDFECSKEMIYMSSPYCYLYKIGLERGKVYNKKELREFVDFTISKSLASRIRCKFYFKDSLLKAAGIRREDLPANCVTRDYNIFNNR
jgi:DNA repair photolyase